MPDQTGNPIFIGALDLIGNEKANSFFGSHQERVDGSEDGSDLEEIHVKARSFDLVIMNPPFTRSTGQEAEKVGVPVPMFAGFGKTEDEQRLMSAELDKIYRKRTQKERAGHGNAGLATNFVDIADEKLKDGGVLALIVLATFVSGKSWSNMRDLLEKRYRDITVVSIVGSKAGTTSFSADTGLNEVLIIATREERASRRGTPITYVNLAKRPDSVLEAAEFAKAVCRMPSKQTQGQINLGSGNKVGLFTRSETGFSGGSGISNPAISKAAATLAEGNIQLPQRDGGVKIPIVELGHLGKRGKYHQDIVGNEPIKVGYRGPFTRDENDLDDNCVPEYPMLWAHHADPRKDDWNPKKWDVRMQVEPDCQVTIRSGADHEVRARKIWRETASRLCFNRDFGFSSNRLAACRAKKPLLGGRAWPNFKCDDLRHEFPIVLWMNTTLGLISFWWKGTRQTIGRSSVVITELPKLPVYDVRELDDAQLGMAKDIFKRFCNRDLLPARQAHQDDVRKALDEEVLVNLLDLPSDIMGNLDLLREMWCAEPSLGKAKKTI